MRGCGAYLRTVLFQVNMVGMAKVSQRRHYNTNTYFVFQLQRENLDQDNQLFYRCIELIVPYGVFHIFSRLVHTGKYVINSF